MKIKLVETCGACPEQYDAFYKGVKVGYLHLRHGYFCVQCGGEVVYSEYTIGDGIFEHEAEREYHLRCACHAIKQWIRDVKKGKQKGDYIF